MFIRADTNGQGGFAVIIFDPPWVVPHAHHVKTDEFGGGVRMVPYTPIQTFEQVQAVIEHLIKARDELLNVQIAKRTEAEVAAKNPRNSATAPAAQGRGHADRKSQGSH